MRYDTFDHIGYTTKVDTINNQINTVVSYKNL